MEMRDDDGGGDHGNHRQGNGEGLGIEGFPADGTVDHENVRADQGGENQRSYDGRGREVRIELVQKRFFQNILNTHVFSPYTVNFLHK